METEEAPKRFLLDLALALFDCYIFPPLCAFGLFWTLKTAGGSIRWHEARFMGMLLGALCAFTGVLVWNVRHARRSLKPGAQREPAYWYAALLMGGVLVSAGWAFALLMLAASSQ